MSDSTVLNQLKEREETLWINPDLESVPEIMSSLAGFKFVQIRAAQNRLLRFMPYISRAFPETEERKGIIESELLPAPGLEEYLREREQSIAGRIFVKDDAHLPVSGSVKARGGIYEVLYHAEQLAMEAGMLKATDDYSILASEEFRDFFGRYTIQVGSTGNLGLSIGIMSAKLGFHVIVHMSAEAKEWKKNLLREQGVCVIEYDGDYSRAVAEGRRLSGLDPMSHFVDDENSRELFWGYATAALRLKVQLYKANRIVDEKHPLFVYLPCGVGGAPGGITYGLKQMFGDYVHCFFAEPVESPCFTLGMVSGLGNGISIYEAGLSGHTIADGLAVGRASLLVCDTMRTLVSGSYTVSDEHLTEYQKILFEYDGIFAEPSACAGIHGVMELQNSLGFQDYLHAHNLENVMNQATHIIWSTGGGMVPENERGL